mmetsp:Transcript_457/g.1578  ORF Transcript_457/g.1578 Transcript_457/m.1578 type:complete len:172 (+) Transcript_457:145-660(+)
MGDAHSAPFQKVVPDLPGHSPHMCQMHVPPREQHSQLLSQASPGEPAGMLLAVTTNSSSSPEAMAGLGGRAPVLVDLPFKDFLVAPPPHDRAVWHLAARKQTASVSSEQILVGCGGFSTESTKLHNLATTQEDKMTVMPWMLSSSDSLCSPHQAIPSLTCFKLGKQMDRRS